MVEFYDVLTSYVSLIINCIESVLQYIFYFPIFNSNLGSLILGACTLAFFIKIITSWLSHKKDGAV